MTNVHSSVKLCDALDSFQTVTPKLFDTVLPFTVFSLFLICFQIPVIHRPEYIHHVCSGLFLSWFPIRLISFISDISASVMWYLWYS